MKGFFSILWLLPCFLFAQRSDYVWTFGSPPNGNPLAGQFRMDFNYFPVAFIETPQQQIDFDLASSSFCDKDGNLLFYTNGIKIENTYGEMVANGDSINPGIYVNAYYESGARCFNCAFFIESPGDTNEILLIHKGADFFSEGFVHNTLYYTIIERSGNNGHGKVLQKNIPIVSGIFTPISATRHANGRDWWVLVMEKKGNKFYKILVDAQGVHLWGEQIIEGIIPVSHPQNDNQYVFSPDGSKLAFGSKFTGIHIFDFDRCTGDLSNFVYIPTEVHFDDIGYGTPMSISPNNRFLYFAKEQEIIQFDLLADDMAASADTVAFYDGFVDPECLLSTTFGLMQLAPNGQIYIATNCYFHVIEFPDKKGIECQVKQRYTQPPFFNYTVPYYPNYRLGPLDHSPCDTLGIDNLPLANFRCEPVDSSDLLTLEFTDLSSYEPTTWSWTFGDGGVSQDTSPVHTFPGNGVYEVCLTVGNENGSDTACKQVVIGTTGVDEELEMLALRLYPNPARSSIYFHWNLPEGIENAIISITDLQGKLLDTIEITGQKGKQEWSVEQLEHGVYTCRLKLPDGNTQTSKLTVIK